MNTNVNWKIAVAGVLGLAVGAAAGYGVAALAGDGTAAGMPPPQKTAAKAAQGDSHLEAQLRGRIAELEARLAAADARKVVLPPAPDAEVPVSEEPPPEGRGGRHGRRGRHGPPRPPSPEELAKLEKENPEEYARTTNFMARMERDMRRARARQEERRGIIASVDTSLLTPEQQQVHERYQELSAQIEEAHKAFRPDAEDVTDEEREAHFQTMRELGREMRELQTLERENLVSAAIASFGLEGDDAADLADTIKSVYDATNGGGGRHGGPGGFGGPPPPPMQ